MILVVDNYDSFTYNLVQMLEALGADVRVERNDALSPAQVVAMEPAGVVISPGPGTPDDAGVSKDVIAASADAGIPVLGVCLGHQCIAEVYGASVVRAETPVHGKTADVQHEGDGLLAGLPKPFTATRYHSLTVAPASVKKPLLVTARTADGLVMALRHHELPVFGVQFHPESVLTPEGVRVLENFLAVCGEIQGEYVRPADPAGLYVSTVLAGGPDASGVLPGCGVSRRSPGEGSAVDSPQAAIAHVVAGGSLSEDESYAVMGTIMDGEATAAQIASLVTAVRMKGETVDEIVGFARAMRERATAVRPRVQNVLDTCGTGGDGRHTFNISTSTAFVVAGAGVPIAKHGNRAVSSSSGSADVLEALGVDISLSPSDVARCIDEVGVGFLFAMALHSSMKHAGGARREIAIRTVFNVLGPLTNPAGAKRQLLGVYDPALVPVMAEVAARLGSEHVLVVHGHPGIDEVSASGPTLVGEAVGGKVETYEITPESVGIARGGVDALAGGDAEDNAALTRMILLGQGGAAGDVVVMNAAAALLAAGAAQDLAEGVAKARESIRSGEAYARLEALVALSKRLAGEAA